MNDPLIKVVELLSACRRPTTPSSQAHGGTSRSLWQVAGKAPRSFDWSGLTSKATAKAQYAGRSKWLRSLDLCSNHTLNGGRYICCGEPLENAIFAIAPNAVEPCLFELRSPLPGNGFLKGETKSPKGLQRLKNAVAETRSR